MRSTIDVEAQTTNISYLDELQIKKLENDLEDNVGLKDYEIDRMNLESKELFKNKEFMDKGIDRTKSIMKKVLIISSIIFIFMFPGWGWLVKGYPAWLYFYISIILVFFYWIINISPIRHHNFPTDRDYIHYRGYMEQGTHHLKAHLRDNKWKYLLLLYWFLDMCVMFAIIDGDFMLDHYNLLIYDRGNYPNSSVSSLMPPLVVIGIAVNIFGAYLVTNYKKIDPITRKEYDDKKVQKIIGLIVIVSFIVLFFVGVMNAEAFNEFWSDPADRNMFPLFDEDEDPLAHARFFLLIYYPVIFLGSFALGFLATIGLTAAELSIIHVMTRQSKEMMEPVEGNWEPKCVIDRQQKEHDDTSRARKAALTEIGLTCLIMILGMWVFLYWGGEIMGWNIMNILGYGILGLGVLWIFFISPIYHVNNDGTKYYPTPLKKNLQYAFWTERGVSDPLHYFREVFGKKKRLIAWLTFWFILCMSMVFFEWDRMWYGGEPRGILVDLGESISLNPNDLVVGTILLMTIITVIGFIFALTQNKDHFRGSMFWDIFYKIIMGYFVFLHFRWITVIPQITATVDLTSPAFLMTFGILIGFFAVVAIACVLIVLPFIVKFDNFHVTAGAILGIIINTVVLVLIMVFIFHVFLPQYDIDGNLIKWMYPFESGPEKDASDLLSNFFLGDLIEGWAGRYIWWGALQQYLFMSYYLVLWEKVFPDSKGYLVACGTSCIFGVIHAIDWVLMLFTGIAGLMWAWNWHKEYYDKDTGKVHRGNNLLLWGLVHGFGGTLIGLVLPFTMGVGPFNV